MQVDDGVFVIPLPEDDEDQRDSRDHGQRQNEMRFEPVITLSFIEDHLQRSEAERDQTEPDVVDLRFAQLTALEVWRILNEPRRQKERKNADGDINEENPAPAKVVGDPTSERGTNGRSHDHRHAIDGECHAALRGRKSIGENGLLARLQAAAARNLKNSEDDSHRALWPEPAPGP